MRYFSNKIVSLHENNYIWPICLLLLTRKKSVWRLKRLPYSKRRQVKEQYDDQVVRILHGLNRIQQLYQKNPVVESENFRNLLLSFAEDMRVILIMIADRVNLMRQIRDTDRVDAKLEVSQEAAYLYAPLAHKLGLYKLKSELEDLSLKYMEHDAYYMIKEKLNATKASRTYEVDTLYLAEDAEAEMPV